LSILGLAKAPSAETVEAVSKYLAEPGLSVHAALSAAMQKQVVRPLGRKVPHGLFFKGFVPVMWKLHGHKQGMENQWKDLLRDMGLHAMPCGKADVNAVFPARWRESPRTSGRVARGCAWAGRQ